MLLLYPTQSLADALFKPDHTCARSFIYRNRTHAMDSSRKLDAEGLRIVLKKHAQSEQLLNLYQNNLKASKWPAYIGSAGLGIALGGFIYANTLENPKDQTIARYSALAVGFAIAFGAYSYGQYAIKNNDRILENAVARYNKDVNKEEKIQVKFAPTTTGLGGEIKTEVPF